MGPVGRAGIGTISSIALHVVVGLGLTTTLTVRDVPDQAAPKSRIDLATKTIVQQEAVPREARGEPAPGLQPDDRQASSGTVRRRDAVPAEAEVRRAPDAIDVGVRVAGSVTHAAVAAIASAISERSEVAESAQIQTAMAIVPELPSAKATAEAPELHAASAAGIVALARRVEAEVPDIEAHLVQQASPLPVAALPVEIAAKAVTAVMAFSGGEQTALDPLGLRAVTAFVAPDSAGAGGLELRSAIDDILSSVPCSRLQASLDSDTGTVKLRGHIPDDAYRVTLTEALRSQIGDALPVVDGLHLLKEPQCGILGQLDALGVPQSEEQFTDVSLIGEDLFVREYAFDDGERMVLELEAADYPAFIYVDYFDASGNVLHLMPNEVMPLRQYPAGEPFAIGAAGSGIDLIVEAPFGQDIVIALASDKALYDGLRPLSEPADEYLRFLRDRIADVAPERAEWVYLLVTTSADR